MYSIPYACGTVYIGQTDKQKIKRTQSYLKNNHVEKSTIMEHCENAGHVIDIAEAKKFQPRFYREATETNKNFNNFIETESSVKMFNQRW